MPRPYQKKRSSSSPKKRPRPAARFPLDPSHLVQRPLAPGADETLPVVTIKSPTRNPTVFRKRIAETDPAAQHGDLVQVQTTDRQLVGYGVWNPRAEATVRILSWDQRPDERTWRQRFDTAIALRRDLLRLDETTSAYRLIHADADGLPGMVVDRYADVLSLEAFSLAMYQRAESIATALAQRLETPYWVIRTGPHTLEQEGFIADGFASPNTPEKVTIHENGVQYEINPFAGHKTGFFCDQRDNRARLATLCRGKSVLDLCCYTGGFAINAALAGAAEVTAVDLDEEAIRLAKRNAQINKAAIKFVHADAFAYIRDMQRNGKTFDVVILDPPKFIRTRSEESDGQSRYYDLNKLAADVIAPQGVLLTCSCSGLFSAEAFTRTVRAATSSRSPRLLLRTGAGADHPVALSSLESEYLKCLWLQFGE